MGIPVFAGGCYCNDDKGKQIILVILHFCNNIVKNRGTAHYVPRSSPGPFLRM